MRPCPICLDLGFYPIFDMDGEQRYSIDCPDCGGTRVEERGGTGEPESAPKSSEPRVMSYRDAALTLVSVSLILANVVGWAVILQHIIVWM